MNKNIEIISLIFKSIDYLTFIVNELKNCSAIGWDVSIRVVANDATEEILDYLPTLGIPYSIYNDPLPESYYINRVYRCYNYAVKTSAFDNVCLVNSDMLFSKNWLDNLLKYHDGINIPCSRLFESGKMRSGLHGVSIDCGRSPSTLDRKLWDSIVNTRSEDRIELKGLYAPCIFEKNKFISSGMYPEGNIYKDGIGTCNGPVLMSGDTWFFNKLETEFNMKHITVFNSLVYHIQEGEKGS